jgi:PhnB protein
MAGNLKIPENHQAVMPYLIVKDAARFIRFMEIVFDGKETFKFMRDEDTIMHAEILVGGSTIMCADSTEKIMVQTAGLFIYVADADDSFKRAVDAGGTIVTELADQSYGRSGGVEDPFGNVWWITSITTHS